MIEDESFLNNELEKGIYTFYHLYFAEELDKKQYSYDTIIENKNFMINLPLEYLK